MSQEPQKEPIYTVSKVDGTITKMACSSIQADGDTQFVVMKSAAGGIVALYPLHSIHSIELDSATK